MIDESLSFLGALSNTWLTKLSKDDAILFSHL